MHSDLRDIESQAPTRLISFSRFSGSFKPIFDLLYRNNLKNRDFDKELP